MKTKKSEKTRKRIFDCAVELFLEHGFKETRVTEIARAAGVARGLLYYYFPSKEDILAYYLRDGLEHFLRRIRGELAEKESSRKKIAHVFSKSFEELSSNDVLCRMFLQEFLISSERSKEFFRLHTRFLKLVEELIDEGKGSGEIAEKADSFMLSRIFFSVYFSWIIAWINKHFPPHLTFDVAMGGAIDTIFEGIAP